MFWLFCFQVTFLIKIVFTPYPSSFVMKPAFFSLLFLKNKEKRFLVSFLILFFNFFHFSFYKKVFEKNKRIINNLLRDTKLFFLFFLFQKVCFSFHFIFNLTYFFFLVESKKCLNKSKKSALCIPVSLLCSFSSFGFVLRKLHF